MNVKLLFVSIIFLLFVQKGIGQVTLSPEIGISYLPYKLEEYEYIKQNKVDFLAGIIGDVRFSEKFNGRCRINYVFRKDKFFRFPYVFLQAYQGHKYINNELNIDFSLTYKGFENQRFGAGIGFVHKINSRLEVFDEDGNYIQEIKPKVLYSANLIYILSLDKFDINFMYGWMVNSEMFIYGISFEKEARNRFDISISFPIVGKGSR